MEKFKREQMVDIYHDPLTCKVYEGKARLVEYIRSDSEMECWKVEFPEDEGRKVFRWLKAPTDET